MLLYYFRLLSVSHVKRDANIAAHKLANGAIQQSREHI
jgi:hypothetical protein